MLKIMKLYQQAFRLFFCYFILAHYSIIKHYAVQAQVDEFKMTEYSFFKGKNHKL